MQIPLKNALNLDYSCLKVENKDADGKRKKNTEKF